MPETSKQKPRSEELDAEERKKDSWGEDQKKREYYYDDAYGYETYEPDDEKEDAD